MKTISYIGPSIWNKLSNSLKDLKTTILVTPNYKKFVLQNLSKKKSILIITFMIIVIIKKCFIIYYYYYYFYNNYHLTTLLFIIIIIITTTITVITFPIIIFTIRFKFSICSGNRLNRALTRNEKYPAFCMNWQKKCSWGSGAKSLERLQ